MVIRLLGVDVDEKLLAKIIQTSERENVQFDNRFFKDKLSELKETIEKLSIAGKEFKKEYLELKNLYESLSVIDSWFAEYNFSDKYPEDTITKTKRLIQVKTHIPDYKQLGTESCIKLEGTGIFSVVEVYIIPFNLVNNTFETSLECLRDVSLHTGGFNSDTPRNKYSLPTDGLYGSSREISRKHFAVIVGNQENEIVKYLDRNLNWRYMAADGVAI